MEEDEGNPKRTKYARGPYKKYVIVNDMLRLVNVTVMLFLVRLA